MTLTTSNIAKRTAASWFYVYYFKEQLLSHILFWMIPYYEGTLIKNIINHYYKKAKQVFKQKKIHKKIVQSQQAKRLGRFEIKLDNVWIANNKQIFAVKLLANLVVASDCCIVLNMFEHVSTFNISHITWGINYNWLLFKAVNVLYAYVQFKWTN